MSAANRQTNDPVQLQAVVERLFSRKPVKLRAQDSEYDVKVISTDGGELHVEHQAPPAQWRLLIVMHNDQQLALECGVKSSHANTEVLAARRLHIRPARRETRVPVKEQPSVRLPMIAECVPLAAFPERFVSMDKKREALLRVYRGAIEERLPEAEVRIVLRTSKRMDHRMRFLNQWHRPIYAPDTRNVMEWGELGAETFIPWKEYETIFRYDPPDKLMSSEIAEPLWYRDLHLFGYIAIQSQEKLDIHHYELAQKVARKLEADFPAHDCLPRNPARCPVADVSESGIGFLYPFKSPAFDAGAFMPGSQVVFDVQLPPDADGDTDQPGNYAQQSFSGTVKSIRDLSTAHRFGVQLDTPMTDDQRTFILELIALQGGAASADQSGAGADVESAAGA